MWDLNKKETDIFSKKEIEKVIEVDKTKFIILIIWEILSMIAVVYIQYFLRAEKMAHSGSETFLLGTLPSLFGAAGFVAILFTLHNIYTKLLRKYKFFNSLVFSFLVTFFGFLSWEIIRMGLYPFDIYDIVMTFAGSLISIVLIITLFGSDL